MTNECQIHKTHNPSVATTVRVPPLPVFLCDRLRKAGVEPPKRRHKTLWVCPTGQYNIEAYALYLLGERDPLPVRVGTSTKVEAQAIVSRYLSMVPRAD